MAAGHVLRSLPLLLLVLVVASCGGEDGQRGVATDRGSASSAPPTAAPTDAPVTTTEADSEAERDAALDFNLNLTRSVRGSFEGRMKDLPERLNAFGMRHGGVSVYETLPSGGIEDTPGNLSQMVKGTSKNILVSTPTEEFYLRYAIAPDGVRLPLSIRLRATTPAREVLYRMELSLHELDKPSSTYFNSSYFDRETYVTQGALGSSALTGERCTADPAHIELIFTRLDRDLQR
jgi:hypothetical protein